MIIKNLILVKFFGLSWNEPPLKKKCIVKRLWNDDKLKKKMQYFWRRIKEKGVRGS